MLIVNPPKNTKAKQEFTFAVAVTTLPSSVYTEIEVCLSLILGMEMVQKIKYL